jgi:hypothetical protein
VRGKNDALSLATASLFLPSDRIVTPISQAIQGGMVHASRRRCKIGLEPGNEDVEMATVEERLASLEARVDAMADLRGVIAELRGDMNRQFAELRGDMNRQFADVREDMNRQFVELREDINRRLVALDEKGDRHFTWMVGTQIGVLLAVIGALVGAYYR